MPLLRLFLDGVVRRLEGAVEQLLEAGNLVDFDASKLTEEVARTDTVCMRENPFYVNTVRNFRDRRYDYKRLTKK